jgi:ribosomal protein L29
MKEISNKTEKELEKLLHEKYKALRIFRFRIAGSKVKNMKEGQRIRKDIARILTELNSRKS